MTTGMRSASTRLLCAVAPLLLALAGIGGMNAASQRVADVGDDTASVEYRYRRPSGATVAGYTISIRVGDLAAIVQVDAQRASALALVRELASAQADCLTVGTCLDPVPVPNGVRAAAGGRPDSPAPMNQADKLRDLLDVFD